MGLTGSWDSRLSRRTLLRTGGAAAVLLYGGVVPGARAREPLFVDVTGTAPLERLELVRSGKVVDALPLEGKLEAKLTSELADLSPGEYVYVRVTQSDGGAAWSSPIFIGERVR